MIAFPNKVADIPPSSLSPFPATKRYYSVFKSANVSILFLSFISIQQKRCSKINIHHLQHYLTTSLGHLNAIFPKFFVYVNNCVATRYPVWVAVLDRSCRAFEVVWLRTATKTLHYELPGGIVLCFSQKAATPELQE